MTTKVTITTGSHTVSVEHDNACLHDAIKDAKKLWEETQDPQDTLKSNLVGFKS